MKVLAAVESVFEKQSAFLVMAPETCPALHIELITFKNAPLPFKSLENAGVIPYGQTDIETARSKKITTGLTVVKSKKIPETKKPASKTCSPGKRCPTCKKGVVSISKCKSGTNVGKPFKGCSKFPACRYFSWA